MPIARAQTSPQLSFVTAVEHGHAEGILSIRMFDAVGNLNRNSSLEDDGFLVGNHAFKDVLPSWRTTAEKERKQRA